MEKHPVFRKGDIVKITKEPIETQAQIMNIISNSEENYYIVKYLNCKEKEKQYDCLKQSELGK